MKVIVVYIYPENGTGEHMSRAAKFIETYSSHDPQAEHDTVVVCNNHPVTEEAAYLFLSLPNLTMVEHDGSGKDIGAFQMCARTFPCDLMVFFGGNTYIKCVGWLRRMIEAFKKYGDTLYGAMGNTGVPNTTIYPHIRTTGWWMSPALLNQYPHIITDRSSGGQRYEFEHGATGLTSWVMAQGKMPIVVAYDGEYILAGCNMIPNGYHQGDQSNLLVGDRMTMPPYYHTP